MLLTITEAHKMYLATPKTIYNARKDGRLTDVITQKGVMLDSSELSKVFTPRINGAHTNADNKRKPSPSSYSKSLNLAMVSLWLGNEKNKEGIAALLVAPYLLSHLRTTDDKPSSSNIVNFDAAGLIDALDTNGNNLALALELLASRGFLTIFEDVIILNPEIHQPYGSKRKHSEAVTQYKRCGGLPLITEIK